MMELSTSRDVSAPADAVWSVLTDLEGAADRISGILEIEILEGGGDFGIGTKWRETRKMFGREATEVMEVTELEPGKSYTTEANSHGAHYRSKMSVEPVGAGSRVTMTFAGEPHGTIAKVMAATVGKLFEGATRKAIQQDLADIAAAAEASSTQT